MKTTAYLTGLVLIVCAAQPAAANEPLAAPSQRVRIGDVPTIPNGRVQVPTVIGSPTAPYSPEGRARKIEGTVTIEAAIDADGTVRVMRVVRGLGYGLDENAVEAVRTWRFVPAYRNGTPVPVIAQIDVEFRVANDPLAETVHVRGLVSAPGVLRRVEPKYPPEARDLKLKGMVTLEVVVSEDGSVQVHRVVRSLGHGLDESAIEAISQWKFSPARLNGKPVKVSLNIEVNFNLR